MTNTPMPAPPPMPWPFPPFPNPLDTGRSAGHKRPKFNPANHEDAPL